MYQNRAFISAINSYDIDMQSKINRHFSCFLIHYIGLTNNNRYSYV